MSIQIVGGIVAVVLVVFAVLIGLAMRYGMKFEREKWMRLCAEKAQSVTDEVVDELSKPLDSDSDFLDGIRPDGVRDDKG